MMDVTFNFKPGDIVRVKVGDSYIIGECMMVGIDHDGEKVRVQWLGTGDPLDYWFSAKRVMKEPDR